MAMKRLAAAASTGASRTRTKSRWGRFSTDDLPPRPVALGGCGGPSRASGASYRSVMIGRPASLSTSSSSLGSVRGASGAVAASFLALIVDSGGRTAGCCGGAFGDSFDARRGLTTNSTTTNNNNNNNYTKHLGSCRCHSSTAADAIESDNDSDAEDDAEEVLAEVEESNAKHSGDIQVKRVNPHQWGVFASRAYAKGSTVLSSRPLSPAAGLDRNNDGEDASEGTSESSPVSCSHTIQVDWDRHVLMELPARFLNHSCDPNIQVGKVNESGSYDFVARRDIDAGEEIRFDYETTEYEIGAFSKCRCGARDCRGVVRGFKHSSSAILERYGTEGVAGYLVRDP